MKKNKISIIIIAYNEEKYISGILDSLKNQTNKDFEVIIVDSKSTDHTELVVNAFANSFDEFRYITLHTALGPAYGRNQGAALAHYDRLLFFDADTRVEPDFIERITQELIDRKLDLATCPMRIAEGTFLSTVGALWLNGFLSLLKPIYSSAYGACFLSTKEVHAHVGGFDEHVGICEDCHYVKKARRHHQYTFGILTPYFYTSDRRATTEGRFTLLITYLRVHVYRMFTGKEISRSDIPRILGNLFRDPGRRADGGNGCEAPSADQEKRRTPGRVLAKEWRNRCVTVSLL